VVPNVSTCPQRFTVFTRIRERYLSIAPNSASISEAISQRVLGKEKAGFCAPKPADWSVESAREKATKQADQKASHRPIDVSLKRATRGSRQRTTQTIWIGKEPLAKTSKTSSKALEKDRWNTRISDGEKPFNSTRKDP